MEAPKKEHHKMLPQRFTFSDTLCVGVLLAPPPVQLLDLAPVDLFHMLSMEYLGPLKILPQTIKDRALHDVKIFYIADSDEPPSDASDSVINAPLTASASIKITSTLSSPEVQPGKLSVLLIPGPDPDTLTPEKYRKFISAHAQCKTTDIITICTGIYPACYSGICDGRVVSGPRGLVSDLKSKFPNIKQFEDKRWSRNSLRSGGSNVETGQRDAELWTAAGITNGHDCVAAYMKEHFSLELAEIVLRMADVEDRGREYGTGQLGEGMWWMSRILRSVFKGLWK